MATARNNVTGDLIKTKSLSKQGRENHDRIFAKKSAHEWLANMPEIISILNDHGWQQGDGITLDSPISYKDFCYRLSISTIISALPK